MCGESCRSDRRKIKKALPLRDLRTFNHRKDNACLYLETLKLLAKELSLDIT